MTTVVLLSPSRATVIVKLPPSGSEPVVEITGSLKEKSDTIIGSFAGVEAYLLNNPMEVKWLGTLPLQVTSYL